MRSDILDIAIPVYNEAEGIQAVLDEIESKISIPHNIHIVYDFDEDTTIPVVKNYVHENIKDNIFLLKNRYGKGALNAIKTGLEITSDGVVLIVMADSSDDLRVVDTMWKKINQDFDIVCGSRYMKGGKQIGGPKFKGFLSRTAGISLHLLTRIPVHDISNSFKMYRTKILKNIQIESSGGFEIGMEIVVKAYLNGCKITEVPSIWRDRSAGKSRFMLKKWVPKYMKWYIFAVKGKYFTLH
jgi:dolichol-phosphate mannosyltransferase